MFVHNKKTIVNLDHIIGIDKDEDAGFKPSSAKGKLLKDIREFARKNDLTDDQALAYFKSLGVIEDEEEY